MSGYDVVREIQALYGAHRPLLIAVTGWDEGAVRMRGKLVGFDHCVTKPYSITDLLDLLKPREANDR
jgi:CheY-like chemotaxis protein